MFSLKLSSPSIKYFENLKTYLLSSFGEKVKKRSFSQGKRKTRESRVISISGH